MSQSTVPATRIFRSQGLHATVHLACVNPKCCAPGVFSSEERIRLGWPGCYLPAEHELHGEPVGGRCPNCGHSREPSLMKRLGEIWRRNFTS